MKPIIISGDIFCTEKIQGIPRYAVECVIFIDRILECADINMDIRICYPKGKKLCIPQLRNIRCIPLECKHKHFRFSDLKKYVIVNKGILVNMGPTIANVKHEIVTIHDVRPLERNHFDSKRSKLEMWLIGLSLRLYRSIVVTVSNYQKERIECLLRIPKDRIYVIGNGWEHIQEVKECETIFKEYPMLKENEYYYSLGSVAKHKNYIWIKETAKRNPNTQFVVSGNISKELWGTDEAEYCEDNILFTGYVTDEEYVSLLKKCKAFIHPSKYEGFGIPPLEAIALGKSILISNSTALPEIFCNAASYFDPDDYEMKLEDNIVWDDLEVKKVLSNHSWVTSAKKWITLFKSMEEM